MKIFNKTIKKIKSKDNSKDNKAKQKKQILFESKYAHKITSKKPVTIKKLKHPFEKFTSRKTQLIVRKILLEYAQTGFISEHYSFSAKKNAFLILKELKMLQKSYNVPTFNSKGQNIHFLFPLTGMSGLGYFYKGFLEQYLPKARFTFLVTPKAQAYIAKGESSSKYLKEHLLKSLNKNDEHFLFIDFIFAGKTKNLVKETINEIYGSKKDFFSIKSPEYRSDHSFNYFKKGDKGERVFSRDVLSNPNKKEIKEQENAIKYTFYYLGSELAARQKLKAL